MARKQQAELIHDRQVADPHRQAILTIAIVDDPYSSAGEKIKVTRSIRDDPLIGLYSRGFIDDAQAAAGRLWQHHYENSEIGGVSAIDPAKEAVDGGRICEPITDKHLEAIKALKEADDYIEDEQGSGLLRDILGRGLSIAGAAEIRGYSTVRRRLAVGAKFRETLEKLAKCWGFA